MTDRVMLDLETLGTEPGAAILSIGAARFDVDGVGDSVHFSVDLASCQDAALTVDADTLEWWLDQDDEAQQILSGGRDLETVLEEFAAWVGDVDEVWANSPAFDCVLLREAADRVDVELPWEYYEQRDVRTLRELPVAVDVEQEGTAHDARDDAVYQAKVASETLQRLQD